MGKIALEKCAHLFPHLNYQKRIMERSFKRQGVVGDIVRDNWYQETLKKRQELGMDKEEKGVKQEIVEEKPVVVGEKVSVVNEVIVNSSQSLASSSNSVDSAGAFVRNEPARDNKDAVRAEIREIENKLQKKKLKKAIKKSGTEIEDGECIDSEEDFDKAEKSDKVIVSEPSAPTQEEINKKKKEENKKRWVNIKGPDRDHVPTAKSEDMGKDKHKIRHSPTKRDRRDNSDSSKGSGGNGSYSGYSRGREGPDRRDSRSYSHYNSGGHYRNNYYDDQSSASDKLFINSNTNENEIVLVKSGVNNVGESNEIKLCIAPLPPVLLHDSQIVSHESLSFCIFLSDDESNGK